jgi:hypothetical protein
MFNIEGGTSSRPQAATPTSSGRSQGTAGWLAKLVNGVVREYLGDYLGVVAIIWVIILDQ